MLTHNDIALIGRQIHHIDVMGDTFGCEFLARIFWANPEAREYFPRDIFKFHREIFDFIRFAAENLERVDLVALAIETLVSRSGYVMPTPRMEAVMSAALLGTLQNRLQGGFSETSRSAWARAFLMVAECVSRRNAASPVRMAA